MPPSDVGFRIEESFKPVDKVVPTSKWQGRSCGRYMQNGPQGHCCMEKLRPSDYGRAHGDGWLSDARAKGTTGYAASSVWRSGVDPKKALA